MLQMLMLSMMKSPRPPMPESRSPISLERRLEAAREWHKVFTDAAAAYEFRAIRARQLAAMQLERIQELETERENGNRNRMPA